MKVLSGKRRAIRHAFDGGQEPCWRRGVVWTVFAVMKQTRTDCGETGSNVHSWVEVGENASSHSRLTGLRTGVTERGRWLLSFAGKNKKRRARLRRMEWKLRHSGFRVSLASSSATPNGELGALEKCCTLSEEKARKPSATTSLPRYSPDLRRLAQSHY